MTMSSSATEQHYTPKEVGAMLNLSPSTVRDLFDGLPGVLRIERPRLRTKRAYTTLRISQSALDAWYARHAGGGLRRKVQTVGGRVEKTLVGRNKRGVVALSGPDGGVAK